MRWTTPHASTPPGSGRPSSGPDRPRRAPPQPSADGPRRRAPRPACAGPRCSAGRHHRDGQRWRGAHRQPRPHPTGRSKPTTAWKRPGRNAIVIFIGSFRPKWVLGPPLNPIGPVAGPASEVPCPPAAHPDPEPRPSGVSRRLVLRRAVWPPGWRRSLPASPVPRTPGRLVHHHPRTRSGSQRGPTPHPRCQPELRYFLPSQDQEARAADDVPGPPRHDARQGDLERHLPRSTQRRSPPRGPGPHGQEDARRSRWSTA